MILYERFSKLQELVTNPYVYLYNKICSSFCSSFTLTLIDTLDTLAVSETTFHFDMYLIVFM